MAALVMLTGCALSLEGHALVAVSASHALKGVADLANAEAHEDFVAHGGESMPESDKAKLDGEWDPKIEAIYTARDVLEAYETAIRQADASGDTSVLAPVARRFVAAWVDVQAVADDLGVTFPNPPEKLLKFVEGSSR